MLLSGIAGFPSYLTPKEGLLTTGPERRRKRRTTAGTPEFRRRRSHPLSAPSQQHPNPAARAKLRGEVASAWCDTECRLPGGIFHRGMGPHSRVFVCCPLLCVKRSHSPHVAQALLCQCVGACTPNSYQLSSCRPLPVLFSTASNVTWESQVCAQQGEGIACSLD